MEMQSFHRKSNSEDLSLIDGGTGCRFSSVQ